MESAAASAATIAPGEDDPNRLTAEALRARLIGDTGRYDALMKQVSPRI